MVVSAFCRACRDIALKASSPPTYLTDVWPPRVVDCSRRPYFIMIALRTDGELVIKVSRSSSVGLLTP